MKRLTLVRIGATVVVVSLAAFGWSTLRHAETIASSQGSQDSEITGGIVPDEFPLGDDVHSFEMNDDVFRLSAEDGIKNWAEVIPDLRRACLLMTRQLDEERPTGGAEPAADDLPVVLNDIRASAKYQLDSTGTGWPLLIRADASTIDVGAETGPDCRLVNPRTLVERSPRNPLEFTGEFSTGFEGSEEARQAGDSTTADEVETTGADLSSISMNGQIGFSVVDAGCRPFVSRVDLREMVVKNGSSRASINGVVEIDSNGVLSGSVHASLDIDEAFIDFVNRSDIFGNTLATVIFSGLISKGDGDFEYRCTDGKCRLYGVIKPFIPLGSAPEFSMSC